MDEATDPFIVQEVGTDTWRITYPENRDLSGDAFDFGRLIIELPNSRFQVIPQIDGSETVGVDPSEKQEITLHDYTEDLKSQFDVTVRWIGLQTPSGICSLACESHMVESIPSQGHRRSANRL